MGISCNASSAANFCNVNNNGNANYNSASNADGGAAPDSVRVQKGLSTECPDTEGGNIHLLPAEKRSLDTPGRSLLAWGLIMRNNPFMPIGVMQPDCAYPAACGEAAQGVFFRGEK
jgi:hypothetical protein